MRARAHYYDANHKEMLYMKDLKLWPISCDHCYQKYIPSMYTLYSTGFLSGNTVGDNDETLRASRFLAGGNHTGTLLGTV